MNKGDLVNEVAKGTRTKTGAHGAVDRTFTTISVALLTHKKVTAKGFGTFKKNRGVRPSFLTDLKEPN